MPKIRSEGDEDKRRILICLDDDGFVIVIVIENRTTYRYVPVTGGDETRTERCAIRIWPARHLQFALSNKITYDYVLMRHLLGSLPSSRRARKRRILILVNRIEDFVSNVMWWTLDT